MPAKKHKPEEIIGKLREVEIMLGQHRSTQRKVPFGADDEEALTEDIIGFAGPATLPCRTVGDKRRFR